MKKHLQNFNKSDLAIHLSRKFSSLNDETIIEGIEPVSIDLALTQDGQEFAVVRNSSGVLWQVNNSGMRWYHSIVDTGPGVSEFELKIDSTGVVNIAYTRSHE